MRITRRQHQQAMSFLREARSFMPRYQKVLMKLRKENVRSAVLKCNKSGDLSALENITEPYLDDFITKLYTNTATRIAASSLSDFFGKASNPLQEELWYNPLMQYIEKVTGERIVLLQGSLQKEMKNILDEVIPQTTIDGYSIEDITQEVYSKWGKAAEWQVRRIINTETLAAASEGQFASIDNLGVNYSKTWIATMINTRDQHKAMMGMSVGKDDLFFLPNGDKMRFPRDLKFNPTAGNVVNCSCSCAYSAVR